MERYPGSLVLYPGASLHFILPQPAHITGGRHYYHFFEEWNILTTLLRQHECVCVCDVCVENLDKARAWSCASLKQP